MLVKVTSTLLLIKFHVSGQWWIGLGEGCPILSWQRPLRSQAKPFGSKAPRAVPRGKPSHVDSLWSPVGELWWWGCLWSAGWWRAPLITAADDRTCPHHLQMKSFWSVVDLQNIWPFWADSSLLKKRGAEVRVKKIRSEFLFLKGCVCSTTYRVFFNWYPPKKLKYGKPWLGVSTLT